VGAHRAALLSGPRSVSAAAFREGARDVLPALVALVPFGLVLGVAAAQSSLSLAQAIGMSYIVFAGSAQLAALQLLALGSPFMVILVTALLINLRFALYSALLAADLRPAPWPLRTLLAAVMTDQALAFSTQRFATHPERGGRIAYYAGVALPVWFVWTTSSTVGVLAGAALPTDWSLEFAVPLVFLTLWIVALLRGRSPVWVAGAVAALVAVVARPLPFNAGLLLAIFAGIAAGLAWEARRATPTATAPSGGETP
jgi:predicted branched-subunit amino acid permease